MRELFLVIYVLTGAFLFTLTAVLVVSHFAEEYRKENRKITKTLNKAPLREKIYLLFKCPRCGSIKPPIKGFKLDWYDLCRKCEKEMKWQQ